MSIFSGVCHFWQATTIRMFSYMHIMSQTLSVIALEITYLEDQSNENIVYVLCKVLNISTEPYTFFNWNYTLLISTKVCCADLYWLMLTILYCTGKLMRFDSVCELNWSVQIRTEQNCPKPWCVPTHIARFLVVPLKNCEKKGLAAVFLRVVYLYHIDYIPY